MKSQKLQTRGAAYNDYVRVGRAGRHVSVHAVSILAGQSGSLVCLKIEGRTFSCDGNAS